MDVNWNDGEKAPTIQQIFEEVGKKRYLLAELLEFLYNNYHLNEEFKYNKRRGWVTYFRKNGKSLAVINARQDTVVVTVVIGASFEEKLKKIPISLKTMNIFESAFRYHDGKWLNIEVESREDIEDVKKLIGLKKPLTRRPRLSCP